jgi:hypothetical protein
MLFCRTTSGVQYISFLNDDGENWSKLKAGNIKSPLSPASIERIPQTNDLLLIWNNNYDAASNEGKRTPFNLAISKDEGATWEKIKPIESDPYGWYCYTAIEFVTDYVLLGHCAGNTLNYGGLETIQITKLSMDWIYKNPTPKPFVASDKNGNVTLACNDKNAVIYFTTDGSLPTTASGQIYKKPIAVEVTTLLQMFAKSDGNTASDLVSTTVGKDIYISANENMSVSGPGLSYKYFEEEFRNTLNIDSSKIISTGTVPTFSIIDHNSGTNFSIIYDGIIQIEKDGLYTFYLNSNDGSLLYIDDYKIIDNDGLHSEFEKSVSLSLRKGLHKISVRYLQAGGGKTLNVSWSSDKFNKSEIPDSVLFH